MGERGKSCCESWRQDRKNLMLAPMWASENGFGVVIFEIHTHPPAATLVFKGKNIGRVRVPRPIERESTYTNLITRWISRFEDDVIAVRYLIHE